VTTAARTAASRAAFIAYRAGAGLAEHLPYSAAAAIAHVGGRVARVALPERAAMVARHQQRVAGGSLDRVQLRRRVRGTFDSYARYWLEIFRVPLELRHGEITPHFTAEGYENIEAGVAAGKGTILALPHLGGWEWAAAWMAELGHDMVAVVEPIDPPELFDWFVHQRQAFGLEIVPLGPDVSSRVLRALRDNRVVCLLCDRDLTGDGIEVDFFGERTTLPGGPATLALRTGAALLPVAVYFDGGRDHRARILPPIPTKRAGRLRDDIARITQALADEFEQLIAAAPDQWHLLQPNWPSDQTERSESGATPPSRESEHAECV
jgi:KDO2-lipid IV(A) lauroyltransferase